MLEDNQDGRDRQYEQPAPQSSPSYGDSARNPNGEAARETWQAPGAAPSDSRADHVEHASNQDRDEYGEVY